MAPRNAYFEFDAQPAMITPYTPTDVSESRNSSPASMSAITSSGDSGITAHVANAGISTMAGAMRNRNLLAFAGRMTSFKQLHHVRERLAHARQDAEDAHAVRALAQLHPADHLALPQRDERHAEDERDGDGRIHAVERTYAGSEHQASEKS